MADRASGVLAALRRLLAALPGRGWSPPAWDNAHFEDAEFIGWFSWDLWHYDRSVLCRQYDFVAFFLCGGAHDPQAP